MEGKFLTFPSISNHSQPSWFTHFALLLRWNLFSIGPALPIVIMVQILMGVSVIVGFGLLIPDISASTAQYLSSGAPTVMLALVGFVLVPQGVSEARINGMIDYVRSLPVPRLAMLFADMATWLLVAIPGVVAGILFGQNYYGFSYAIHWPILIGSIGMVAIMASAVGYAIAMCTSRATAMAFSQILAFGVLLFSPISFPASALPQWAQWVHHWLPFESAGDLIRASLLRTTYTIELHDILVLTSYTCIGLLVTARVLTKRE